MGRRIVPAKPAKSVRLNELAETDAFLDHAAQRLIKSDDSIVVRSHLQIDFPATALDEIQLICFINASPHCTTGETVTE